MTHKLITFIVFSLLVTACKSEVVASETKKRASQTDTTISKTTDELGNDILNVKSTRNEGYTVHPSTEIGKTSNDFYCEGFKIESLIIRREENQEVRAVDLTVKINGENIDLKPIIGSKSNLYGYSNLETQFSCVDQIVRMTIQGQPYMHENKLAPPKNIIDFLVDRKTGRITSKSKK